MKLDDFEYYVEEKVLERGQKLFKDSKVRYKDKFGANWYFDVLGSKIYRIVICVNKNNVITSPINKAGRNHSTDIP